MLLASAYRKLDRDDDALDLLQAERLRAASFVLSSLMQEVGMRDDAAFALAADAAADAVFEALGMGAVNPFFSATMFLEVAEVLRRAGEKDGALDALARAADAVRAVPAHRDPSGSPLWDRMADHLDPSQAGEAWAEHKARQADEVESLMRQAFVERVSSSEWSELVGDDPRYLGVLAMAEEQAASGDSA